MQLPRGTFREIKKNEVVRNLLEGLENERFSGICTLSSSAVNGVLVYRKGKYILAKVGNTYGDTGIAELRTFLDRTADAALSMLDETQINLAIEFNKQAVVTRTGSVIKESPASTPSNNQSPRNINPPSAPDVRVRIPGNTPHPAHPRSSMTGGSLLQKTPQNEESKGENSQVKAARYDHASFDLDMEAIDALDLDKVKDKIRGDCKTMIKQLDLEYLLER